MGTASRLQLPPFVACAFLVIAAIVLSACSNRPAIAAKATVHTFYSAIQADDVPVVEDNLAQTAAPSFRRHVEAATVAAQAGGAAERAVQIVRVDSPSIRGSSARVPVRFADGASDIVTLTQEGLRWKVVTSGRLG
jgi:hypothetical protein